MLKLEGDGDVSWWKTYADTASNSIQETTTEGGYILAGSGGGGALLLKLDSNGNASWGRAMVAVVVKEPILFRKPKIRDISLRVGLTPLVLVVMISGC